MLPEGPVCYQDQGTLQNKLLTKPMGKMKKFPYL